MEIPTRMRLEACASGETEVAQIESLDREDAKQRIDGEQGFEPTEVQQDGEIVWEIPVDVAQQKLIERGILDA